MGLFYYMSHYKVNVNDLVYTVHKYPDRCHHSLIFANKVHGIYQVNIDCPYYILKYIYIYKVYMV